MPFHGPTGIFEGTAEEAAARQLALYQAGVFPPNWRWHSLRKGYQAQARLEHGTGVYSVNLATNEVCEGETKWFLDGEVLLCIECYEDGT